jgi:hypothetical protein
MSDHSKKLARHEKEAEQLVRDKAKPPAGDMPRCHCGAVAVSCEPIAQGRVFFRRARDGGGAVVTFMVR